MKKTIQRIMTLALCLMMCVSLLPMPTLAAGEVSIDDYYFPDGNFRQYVSDKIDTNHNGSLSSAEINAVKSIDVSNKMIDDLTGVHIFTKLEELRCDNNNLHNLGIGINTALKTLSCRNNQLYSLDLSQNTALTTLDCRNNDLRKLDLRKNTLLENLNCGNNYLGIGGLNLSQNTLLTDLDCSEMYIDIAIRNCPKLVEAYVNGKKSIHYSTTQWTTVEYKSSTGSLKIDSCTKVTTGLEPKVTTQPKSVTVKANKTATFKVKATGGSPQYRWSTLKYQWYVKKTGTKNWVKLSGKTAATLKIKATKKMNGYQYRCKVYNKRWQVYSKTVKLKVK